MDEARRNSRDHRQMTDTVNQRAGADPSAAPTARVKLLAFLAGAAATVIWASWIVSTRYAVTTELDAVATGFLRFAVPAIIFFPVWIKIGLIPRGVPIFQFALLVAGGGFGVHLFSAIGMQFAPVAHFGALAPGTIPLFVAVFMFLLERERVSRLKFVGLVLILSGMLILSGWSIVTNFSQYWFGHLCFLGTATIWAGYLIVFRRLGLNPFQAAGLIGAWSAIVFAPLAAFRGFRVLLEAPVSDVLLQTLVQGLLTSVVAFVLFGYTLTVLGAARAALFTCIVPPLATVFAVVFLGEWPGWYAALAVAVVTVGVLFASGAVTFDRRPPRTGRRPGAPL